jgi:hypothetical protein
MKTFFIVITERETVAISAKVALIVDSILVLINYGDRIFLCHDMHAMDWIKIAITYCVPYCVATNSAAKYALIPANNKKDSRSNG